MTTICNISSCRIKDCTRKRVICRKKIGSLHPGLWTWWVGKVIIRTSVVLCWRSSRCWSPICSMTMKKGIGKKEINTPSRLKIKTSEANEWFRRGRMNWKRSCVPIWLRIPNVQGVSEFVAVSWNIFLIISFCSLHFRTVFSGGWTWTWNCFYLLVPFVAMPFHTCAEPQRCKRRRMRKTWHFLRKLLTFHRTNEYSQRYPCTWHRFENWTVALAPPFTRNIGWISRTRSSPGLLTIKCEPSICGVTE